MKLVYLLGWLLLAGPALAQSGLAFDKRFIECEDKWVVFRPDKDGSYHFGFIYIDAQAGPTEKAEGSFRIGANGRWERTKALDSINMRVRLQPNQVQVALLPATRLAELRLPAVPEWLHYYKTDTASAAHYYRWGFTYNAYDNPAGALPYLLRAARLAPATADVAAELAYAYNALQRYAEAMPAATRAIADAPKDCYPYKELAYAQGHLDQLEQAAATYAQARAKCPDQTMHCEIAYNIAARYFARRDKASFLRWATEARRQARAGDQYRENLARMEAQLDR